MNATPLSSDPRAFKSSIVTVANRNAKALTGDFTEVQKLVDENELVFAVWQEPGAPDGVATTIVKGARILREIATSARAKALSWTAIPCSCAEQAEALRQVAGEPDQRH